MAKRPDSVNLKRRIRKLCQTTTRGIGWNLNYRDPKIGIAKKHRFEIETETEAKVVYTKWHLSAAMRAIGRRIGDRLNALEIAKFTEKTA